MRVNVPTYVPSQRHQGGSLRCASCSTEVILDRFKYVITKGVQVVALVALASMLLISIAACTETADESLSTTEIEAIKAASRAYGTAWLSNDPESVMATLTDDAVIVPSGMSSMQGEEAIRAFWWPEDSPPTMVTEFTSTEEEAGGHGGFGFVRGTFTLRFQYDGADFSSGGAYLCLMRRLPDDSWRISHRMWSDGPPE